MTIIITSTTKIVTLNGVSCRIWEGQTTSGIEVHAYMTRIACPVDADAGQFDVELEACATPSVDVASIPARMLI